MMIKYEEARRMMIIVDDNEGGGPMSDDYRSRLRRMTEVDQDEGG